jgi:hypothetical protein
MPGDRMKGAITALARRADPLALYRAQYHGRVLRQSVDLLRVDVAPDDPWLPQMSNIFIRYPFPGMAAKLNLTGKPVFVLLSWENGRPDRPYVFLSQVPAEAVERISLPTSALELGAVGAADAVIKGDAFRRVEKIFLEALAVYAAAVKPIADPSGAATGVLKTAIEAYKQADSVVLSTVVRTA